MRSAALAPIPAVLLLLSLALCGEARAARLEAPAVRVVVSPALFPEAWRRLSPLGAQVVVTGVAPPPSRRAGEAGIAWEIPTPLTALQVRALKAAQPASRCRIVLQGAAGFSSADLDALDTTRLELCARELRLRALPEPVAARVGRWTRASVILEAEDAASVPAEELARLAQMPQPMLSVPAANAPALLGRASSRAFPPRLGWGIRADSGRLTPEVLERLARREREPVRVFALGGLARDAAEALRRLPSVSVEVRLDAVEALDEETAGAVAALLRAVDPPGERPIDLDRADDLFLRSAGPLE